MRYLLSLIVFSLFALPTSFMSVSQGQQAVLKAPASTPNFATATVQIDLKTELALTMHQLKHDGTSTFETYSIPVSKLACFDLDGNSVPENSVYDRFKQTPVPVLTAAKLLERADLNFYKAIAKPGTLFIVYQPRSASNPGEIATSKNGNEKSVIDLGGEKEPALTSGQPKPSVPTTVKSAEPTYQLTLEFEMADGNEIADIREFKSIEINQQVIPFGAKTKLADDIIYVQRKTDSLIVHGLTAGDYSISVAALVKPKLFNTVDTTAVAREVNVDSDSSTTLKFGK